MRVSLLLLLLPSFAFTQVYKFNRQIIMHFEQQKTKNLDTWIIPIEIDIRQTVIIMRRPKNGIREKPKIDTLQIKSKSKETDFTKIITKDNRTILVYNDELITMVTKETKDGKRIEYCFYNQN